MTFVALNNVQSYGYFTSDISREQSLCIIFRIFSNLLKLIYRTYAGFICIFIIQ